MPENNPTLPDFTRWPSFPFEGDMRVKALADPVDVEPPRSGEDAADCVACNTPDEAYIWVSDRWRVRAMDRPTGLPIVLILECRSHLDLGDLPNLLAAELGVMTVRIERAVRSLDGVARVHVNRWGDGSAHLHMWFLARPYGRLQLRGTFLSLWDDILPVISEDQWRENQSMVAAWLAEFGGQANTEPAHIQWQSPSTIGETPSALADPDPTPTPPAATPSWRPSDLADMQPPSSKAKADSPYANWELTQDLTEAAAAAAEMPAPTTPPGTEAVGLADEDSDEEEGGFTPSTAATAMQPTTSDDPGQRLITAGEADHSLQPPDNSEGRWQGSPGSGGDAASASDAGERRVVNPRDDGQAVSAGSASEPGSVTLDVDDQVVSIGRGDERGSVVHDRDDQAVSADSAGERGVLVPDGDDQAVSADSAGERGVVVPDGDDQAVTADSAGERGVVVPDGDDQAVTADSAGERGVVVPDGDDQAVSADSAGERGPFVPGRGKQAESAGTTGERRSGVRSGDDQAESPGKSRDQRATPSDDGDRLMPAGNTDDR